MDNTSERVPTSPAGSAQRQELPGRIGHIWQRFGLSVKANIVVVLILGMLLGAIITLLHISIRQFTIQQARTRLNREIQLIQDEIQALEQIQLHQTLFLAATTDLAQLLVEQDDAAIAQFMLRNSLTNFFDDVEFFDTNGNHIISLQRNATTILNAEQQAELVDLALLGIWHTRILQNDADGQVYLVTIAPVENSSVSDQVLGVVLTEQVIDETFLSTLASTEENIDLSLIANGQLVTQYIPAHEDVPTGEETEHDNVSDLSLAEDELLQSVGIPYALSGRPYIADHLFDRHGELHALGYAPLTVGGETAAVLAIVAEQKGLHLFEERFVNQLALTFVVLGLIAVGAIFLFMRSTVIHPLQTVQRAAAQMAQDHTNLHQQIAVTSSDEVGQLSTSFNTMARNLSTLYTSLEARVAERTSELRQALSEVEAARAEAEAANEQIRSMNEKLEARVATRTAELSQNQALLQSIIDNLPAMLYVKDSDNRYTLVNDSVASLIHMDKQQLIGKTADDFFPPDLAARWHAQDQHVYATGQAVEAEEVFTGPDGQRTYQSIVFPIYNGSGSITAIGGIANDITERKRMETERATLQQQIITAQQSAIRELSTPLIPISENSVVMPLIGTIDSSRAQQIMETLLEGVAQHRATIAILDITGVQVVDTQVANALVRAAQAVKLLGAQVVLTGIRPEVAQTLVHLGAELSGIVTWGMLQDGIAYALARQPRPSLG